MLLLAQQGKISLDDPLRKDLPVIAEYRGLPEGRLVYNNQDLLEMASMQHALNFDPGGHYSYTHTGVDISTILVERALGM